MEAGVDGSGDMAFVTGGSACRRGDEVRLWWPLMAAVDPGVGELFLSGNCLSCSRTEDRTGEVGGKTSSAGFLLGLCLLGDPEGLAGRSSGDDRIRPAPSMPGIDLVRDIGGGARLQARSSKVKSANCGGFFFHH